MMLATMRVFDGGNQPGRNVLSGDFGQLNARDGSLVADTVERAHDSPALRLNNARHEVAHSYRHETVLVRVNQVIANMNR